MGVKWRNTDPSVYPLSAPNTSFFPNNFRNKKFPQSYKISINATSIGYHTDTLGQERMFLWRHRIFAHIPLLWMRPPTLWRSKFTALSQVTSPLSKHLSPTLASFLNRRQTLQISLLNILQQGLLLLRSNKIDRRQAKTFFILLPFLTKRRGHVSILINPSTTISPPDSLRRILYLPLFFLLVYQHHQHLQPLQVIIPCQTSMSTLQQRSFHWCTKLSIKTQLWWHNSKPELLLCNFHIH